MLPIDEVLPELRNALRRQPNVVLQAPPGTGKTTRVPIALLGEPWLSEKRIVMLEPRRLAARAAASYMAQSLGEAVGETVGYRIRFDTRVSARTRVEVVTEGVLTRLLQSDPSLEAYALVIFDEFHERSLNADVGLALTLQARKLFRPELRVLVMSATLASEPVAELLAGAPVVRGQAQSYQVATHYSGRRREIAIEATAADQVHAALARHDGDVLVFLPGAAEIQRTHDLLRNEVAANVYVAPLFGNLPQEAQNRAIAASRPGERKIVLATSIAETSLTIEGVRVVIDSGLMRVPRFDARTGMTRLETVRVTRASADQRRGRAGRVAPGTCYRLWSEYEEQGLVPYNTPEILEADLAPLALDLAAWGATDPAELSWLDAPPAAAYAQARELLVELGAVDQTGAITPHGRRVVRLPLHPRLAHMLLRAQELGYAPLATELAALLSERDVLRGDAARDPDVHLRLRALRRQEAGADRQAVQRVRREAEHLRRLTGAAAGQSDDERAGLLLAFAYPDRIAQKRPEARGRFLLRNGRGAVTDVSHALAGEEYIVAAQLEGRGRDSRVYLAAALSESDLRQHFAEQIEIVESVEWSDELGARALRRERLGTIVLKESTAATANPDAVAATVLQSVLAHGLGSLTWSKAATQLRQRLEFVRGLDTSWPDASLSALEENAVNWLLPQLYGVRTPTDLKNLDLEAALLQLLNWEMRKRIDELAPTHLTVPSGSRIAIDYSDTAAPAVAVRLQEVFGLQETPRIGGGKVPLTLQLLSPAQRPVQVTRDLASFWRSGYFEVKKELKGKYPKHYWPDDPTSAQPTRRVRPRKP